MNPAPRMLRPLLEPVGRPHDGGVPRLVVCPYGGSSHASFRSWKAQPQPSLAASLAIYPGRDHRIHEPFADSVQALAAELTAELSARPPRGRWVLVGHSIGAQVAFETCRQLEYLRLAPCGLVLSACHAPHLTPRRRLGHFADHDFIEALIDGGGCPPEMRTDADFRAVFLPMLRNDFRISECYHRPLADAAPRLHTPALLLYGSSDDEAHPDEVAAWGKWLSDSTEISAIDGNHFYITQRFSAFILQVSRTFALTSEYRHVTASGHASAHLYP